jgi:DNA-binding HxlR family transcriptional regulator
MTREHGEICLRYRAAIDVLGKRWTALVLNLLMGGPMRFGELVEKLEGVGDRILSERLKELEAEGIVLRRVVPTHPVRVEYELTEKGRGLIPALKAIEAWAQKWIELEEKPKRKC